MLDESDSIPARREAGVGDAAGGLVHSLADGEFNAPAPGYTANGSQARSIRPGPPDCFLNVLENLSRRAAGHGHSRQRAASGPPIQKVSAQRYGHFTGRRNG